MAKTRIAVAGAGLIGQVHMRAAQASPTCTLSAVVDPSPAAAEAAAKAGVTLYPSLAALFAADKPDGIVLATPNQLHVSQALECIDAGVPQLLEKPIASSVVEGERLVRKIDETGARVLIGHHRAHSPIMGAAKEIVDSGKLGRLVAITGTAMFFKPDHYFDEGPWRKQPGGGPLLINMIHEVHNLRMLAGDIVAVQAFASNATRGFAVEDTVAINLRFAGGALGTFLLSDTAASPRSWEQTSQENKAYPSYDDEDCYIVAGTRGSLAIPTMRMKSYPRDEDRSWWKPFSVGLADVVRDDPIRLQMEHFGAVIRGEAEPLVTARDGLQNLIVTEAILEATKSGGAVAIR
jgi:predicted dehydrogenase